MFRDGGAGRPGGAIASNFPPNITLKQLRFRMLVVKFLGESCKMLYYYLESPPPIRNSARLSPMLCVNVAHKVELGV